MIIAKTEQQKQKHRDQQLRGVFIVVALVIVPVHMTILVELKLEKQELASNQCQNETCTHVIIVFVVAIDTVGPVDVVVVLLLVAMILHTQIEIVGQT